MSTKKRPYIVHAFQDGARIYARNMMSASAESALRRVRKDEHLGDADCIVVYAWTTESACEICTRKVGNRGWVRE